MLEYNIQNTVFTFNACNLSHYRRRNINLVWDPYSDVHVDRPVAQEGHEHALRQLINLVTFECMYGDKLGIPFGVRYIIYVKTFAAFEHHVHVDILRKHRNDIHKCTNAIRLYHNNKLPCMTLPDPQIPSEKNPILNKLPDPQVHSEHISPILHSSANRLSRCVLM